jgi:hypothetical protein
MTGPKQFTLTIGLLLFVALGIEQMTPALARGFCNVDGGGPPPMQDATSKAAAAFFDGGSHLMAMLSALELGDSKKPVEDGSSASKSFGKAGEMYKFIKGEDSVDQKLVVVDPKTAAAIAKVPDTWPGFLAIAEIVKKQQPSANLFTFCATRALEMRDSTEEFIALKKKDVTKDVQEKDIAKLLVTFSAGQ